MPDAMLAERLAADTNGFPDVVFPLIEVAATISARFALKNADDHAKAKRAVEAARKLLADSGATVTIEFGEPQ